MPIPAEQRFWKFVFKTHSCWFWIGCVNEHGYGFFSYPPRQRAHHIAWFLATGHWPEKHLLHSCDTPQCVNPAHLREGTNLENHQDAARKGVNPNLIKQFAKYCKYGHRRTEGNLITSKEGLRACKTCNNLRAIRWQKAKRTGQPYIPLSGASIDLA